MTKKFIKLHALVFANSNNYNFELFVCYRVEKIDKYIKVL